MPQQPRPGDYGVCATPGFIPWLIRKVTKSWADHAFIVLDDGDYDGPPTIVEAEPGGVRFGRLSEYDGCRVAFNTAEPTTQVQRNAVVVYAEQQLATAYNWTADLADGLAALGLPWRLLAKTATGKRAVMCSQLVVKAGMSAGLTGWECDEANPAYVTPAMLAKRIDDQDW